LEPLVRCSDPARPATECGGDGNHEYYAGLDRSVALLEAAGYTVLRIARAAEVVTGLVLARVDDLGVRRQFGGDDGVIERALADRPPGAVVLLSHSPLQSESAAALGVGLMLSGHTTTDRSGPSIILSG